MGFWPLSWMFNLHWNFWVNNGLESLDTNISIIINIFLLRVRSDWTGLSHVCCWSFQCLFRKEYFETTRGLLSLSSAYITFNDCNGKYGEGTDCLRMLVFKAISLINDLTETGQEDSRRLIYEEVPNCSDHSGLLCPGKGVQLFVYTVFNFLWY